MGISFESLKDANELTRTRVLFFMNFTELLIIMN